MGALPKKSVKSNHRKQPFATYWADVVFAQKVVRRFEENWFLGVGNLYFESNVLGQRTSQKGCWHHCLGLIESHLGCPNKKTITNAIM